MVWYGSISSGKGTVGEIFENDFGYQKESFAKSIKDVISVMFDWDREMLEGATPESRKTREEVDEYWKEKFSGFAEYIKNEKNLDISPRGILQYFGEKFRNEIDLSYWIKMMQRRFEKEGIDLKNNNIVITDTRYKNEIDWIKSNGGYIIEVRRGNIPEWYSKLHEFVQRTGKIPYYLSSEFQVPKELHISEYDWIGYKVDAIVSNNGSLEDLSKQVKDKIQNIEKIKFLKESVDILQKTLYN